VLQGVAVCAVCCRVLQGVTVCAVCCRVLQGVAVCCSVSIHKASVYVCLFAGMFVCMYVCIHTHTHTCTCADTDTQMDQMGYMLYGLYLISYMHVARKCYGSNGYILYACSTQMGCMLLLKWVICYMHVALCYMLYACLICM